MTPINEMAAQFENIYDEYTKSVCALGSKVKGSKKRGKFGSHLAKMIGGDLVTTERDRLSQDFLDKVIEHRTLFLEALKDEPEAAQREAAGIACDVLMQVRPEESNSTTNLMKRAMIGQAEPILPYLTPQKAAEIYERINGAYSRGQILPVEKDMLKILKKMMKDN